MEDTLKTRLPQLKKLEIMKTCFWTFELLNFWTFEHSKICYSNCVDWPAMHQAYCSHLTFPLHLNEWPYPPQYSHCGVSSSSLTSSQSFVRDRLEWTEEQKICSFKHAAVRQILFVADTQSSGQTAAWGDHQYTVMWIVCTANTVCEIGVLQLVFAQ